MTVTLRGRKQMKVLIAGGGTGGHIYPAITIGKALEEKGATLLFAGARQGLEKELVPKAGYPIELIPVDYFPRRLSRRLVKSVWTAGTSVFRAMALVRRFQPDACIGTGGYVAGPITLASALLGVPTVIQEQNALPGFTNRVLAYFVDRVALGYDAAKTGFRQKDKLIVTGNPIRPEIMSLTRQEGAARLGLNPKIKTVLSFGASQGARSINQSVLGALSRYQQMDAQFLHVTGERDFDDFHRECVKDGHDVKPIPDLNGIVLHNVKVVPYLHDMPAALACADLVVGRAGALSISEMTAKGLPAILIPYPHAAENHQEKNARVLQSAGAAEMILDRDLNSDVLAERVEGLLGDGERLKKMSRAAKGFGRPDAVWDIVALVEGLVAAKSRSGR